MKFALTALFVTAVTLFVFHKNYVQYEAEIDVQAEKPVKAVLQYQGGDSGNIKTQVLETEGSNFISFKISKKVLTDFDLEISNTSQIYNVFFCR
ncbi:MAG: hypothetical protein IJ752_06550 [Alphaproteobacteria bacterium]|nr:hypothetical protein [Alphaproteobacteria bacterium]